MIKRYLTCFLLVVGFLLTLPLAAYADVLVEPNNDFYSRHRNDCTSLNRGFYANGEAGSVSLKKEPGSKNEVAIIENGEILHIMFTYSYKGELWGVTELYTPDKSYGEWPTGWVPMNQLLLVYDYISFSEDYQDEFYPYSGGYETLKAAQEIVFWPWPGSDGAPETINLVTFDMKIDENFGVSHAYRDEQGREWGFVNYWYGRRNVWVCLSEPANSDIPAFNPAPTPNFWQPDNTYIPNNGLSTSALIIILVAALVVGTVVLIRIFWKQNKDQR